MQEMTASTANDATRVLSTHGLHGLIWSFWFGADGVAHPLSGEEALDALDRRDGWVWLHFDLIDGRARTTLQNMVDLPEDAREIMLGHDDHQRIDTFGEVIAGVVTDFERAEELDPRRMLAWRFCMLPHAFISARRSPLHTMARVHDQARMGRHFAGVLHLFDAVVDNYAATLAAVVQEISAQLNDVEDSLLDEREQGDHEMLGLARRSTVRLHRATVPLRAILRHLLRDRPSWFTADAAEDCEQAAEQVESVIADLGALKERGHALQDELASRQAELTNRKLTLLSVFSAFILPPTLISGIFGMNVDGLPFREASPNGFALTLALMAGSVAVLLLVLRRLKLV